MATKRWIGNAIDVAQVTTWTVIDTWATADTVNVTINNKTLTLTVGTASTVTDVATDIAAMINGTAAGTGYTRTETGDNVPEFAKITASNVAGVLTLTADTKGVPFTVTITETTAGDGSITENGDTTAATGKHFFDDADNWDTNAVPVDADDIIVENGDVSILYGLDQSGVTPASIKIKQNYTGKIGLPVVNIDDPSNPYNEYRFTYLGIGAAADATDMQITIGEGDGAGSGRIKLDTLDSDATIRIVNSGSRIESDVPAILLRGVDTESTLEIDKGDVGTGFFGDNGAAALYASIRLGWINDQIGDSTLEITQAFSSAVPIIQTGGTLILTAAGAYVSTLTIYGGETIAGILVTDITTVTVESGVFDYRGSGTITTLVVGSDGVATFRHNQQGRTVANCNVYEAATVRDPARTVTWSNGIDLVHTSIYDADTPKTKLDIGTHFTITPSAIV